VGRFYAITLDTASITAANTDYDLFSVSMADDKPVRFWELTIAAYSEIAEAQEEWLRVQVIRGYTSVGSGGNSVATVPQLNLVDTAAGFTARTADPTVATTGTVQILWAGGFNVRAGLEKVWLPETTPWASQASTTMIVRMLTTVADTLDLTGTLVVEEI
jgi:hypothetical protein